MARRTIKIPQKDSKEIEMSQDEKVSEIISSLDSIQGKQHEMSPEITTSLSKTKIIMIITFFSIVTLGLLSLGSYPQTEPNSTQKTISAELDFKFQLLNGDEVMLSDYAGDPIILDLMAIYCEPCKTQITELKTLKSSYSNVQIISVSVDLTDDTSRLTEYKNENGMTWILGRDISQKAIGIFTPPNKPQLIPTIAFINSAGILKQLNQGIVSYKTLVEWIAED